MATQLQIRRGTTAQMGAFTGAEGELAVNTSTDTVHVHDGATAGGHALAKADGSNIGTYAGSFTTLAASGAVTLSSTLTVSSNVGIGNSSPSSYFSNARNLVVGGTTGANGMTISGSTDTQIFFADGTSGADAYRGIIRYSHADDGFSFWTNATRALDISSAGSVGIGTASPASLLDATGAPLATSGAILRIRNTSATASNTSYGGVLFSSSPGTDFSIGKSNVNAATSLSFRNGNTGASLMELTSSGKVGIGSSSPNAALDVTVSGSGIAQYVTNTSSSQAYTAWGNSDNPVWSQDFNTPGGLLVGIDSDETAVIYQGGNKAMRFGTNATERMRLTAVGDLYFAQTSGSTSNVGTILQANGRNFFMASTTSEAVMHTYNNTSSSGAKYKISFQQNGTQVGVIEVGSSSTGYISSSDYRLKENVVAITGATERLKQLNPSRFNFIADADTTVDGFLAHEVQDVVPEAITGTKDAVDADGNPEYQGIDQSKLVPLLVATIQELEARLTALENN